MNKIIKDPKFYFIALTLLFHLFLMIKTFTDEKYILSAILLIPVSIFSYKIYKMILGTK